MGVGLRVVYRWSIFFSLPRPTAGSQLCESTSPHLLYPSMLLSLPPPPVSPRFPSLKGVQRHICGCGITYLIHRHAEVVEGEEEEGKAGREFDVTRQTEWGGKEAGGKERGERRGGEQGTGNHRYVQDGGWVAWREDREKVGLWTSEQRCYGETKEEVNTHMHHVGPPDRVVGLNPWTDQCWTSNCLWEAAQQPQVQNGACAGKWKQGEVNRS